MQDQTKNQPQDQTPTNQQPHQPTLIDLPTPIFSPPTPFTPPDLKRAWAHLCL
ncbi:hypothetical protein [Helicobacter gastrocanis]|uniref:hypothetical protein n=1 Tax=Helicobacter gastrocanis TaxID=2849641 RepID=UPI001C865F7B|nr:hypothetical protein [Helicobacter sp. NHP19-003]